MKRLIIRALVLPAALAAIAGFAQTLPATQAQILYDQQILQCNTLGAPQRDACVRNAGAALDRIRAGTTTPETTVSTDGRATVVPAPSAPALNPDTATTAGATSPDGRSTVIPPASVTQ